MLAAALAGEVKGAQVVNRLSVATPNQVNLHVRIAEVDRNILKQIGINWSKAGTAIGQVSAPLPSNQRLTISIQSGRFRRDVLEQISATVDALATEGFLTVLGRAQSDRGLGPDRELSRRRRIPVPGGPRRFGRARTGNHGPVSAIRRSARVHADDHRRQSSEPRVRPEVSQLRHARRGDDRAALTIPALTVRQRRNHGRARQRAELRARRAAYAQHQRRIFPRFPGSATSRSSARCSARTSSRTTRPSWSSSSRPIWSDRRRRRRRRRPTASRSPHDAQQVLWGDTWRRSLPAPARGPLDAGGGGLIGPAGFRLD